MNEACEHWSIKALAKNSKPLFADTLTTAVAKRGGLSNCQELVANVTDSVPATSLLLFE